MRLEELELLTSGQIYDLMIEKNNDSYDYPKKATTEDYDKWLGG